MAHDARERTPGTRRMHVLVVEDDDDMRTFLCEVLRAHGYAASGVVDDAQALLFLRETAVDAIILDNALPGLSGLELLPGIRRVHPDAVVILISAFGGPATGLQARERGAAAYLPKPFRVAGLLAVLTREGELGALRRRLADRAPGARGVETSR